MRNFNIYSKKAINTISRVKKETDDCNVSKFGDFYGQKLKMIMEEKVSN